MKRHSGSGRFARKEWESEDINPLDGVANLSDVMLVFACGLMLALITFWNVDVAAAQSTSVDTPPQQITAEVSNHTENPPSVDNENLEQVGLVYRDPATGKLYMMTEE